MPYDPKPTKYPFPIKTCEHYLPVKHCTDTVFDKDYPYVDNSFGYKFIEGAMRVITVLIAFPVVRLVTGLKIEGKENLKKHKKILKNGVVSVANHVHQWDFITIMDAVRPFRPWIPAWDINMRGENRHLIRYSRGIPLPVGDRRATAAFAHAIDGLLQEGHWLHVAAEASMWEDYMPIRPFKKGAATFAVRNNVPVLPLAFSYREPKGICKLIWRRPWLTLHIGEPIYRDPELNKVEAAKDLTRRAHAEVCHLAGIDPEENIYEPLYQNSERIDYYTVEYGVNKKRGKKAKEEAKAAEAVAETAEEVKDESNAE